MSILSSLVHLSPARLEAPTILKKLVAPIAGWPS